MVSYSLNTICAPVEVSNVGLSYIIRGMLGLFGTVKGGLMPSPQKPGPTYLKFLLLCGLLILCSPVSCQSAENGITSKQLLTTYSTTCTELEQRVNKSYSAQGCLPLRNEPWPLQDVRWWQCKPRRFEGWAFRSTPPSLSGYCVVPVADCKHKEYPIKVFQITPRYGDEKCEEVLWNSK